MSFAQKLATTTLFLLSSVLTSPAQEAFPTAFLNPKRLSDLRDAYPMLSPDGRLIVFQSNRSGEWHIYVIKADATELRQLTTTGAPNVSPVWSPDGTRIAFASERDGNSEIYVMRADGSDQQRLTNHPGDDAHPHWSPDGSRIIFNSARTTPDLKADWSQQFHEVFSMKLDGSDLRQHTHCRSVCTYPVWSPDGGKIAYRKVTQEPGLRWDLTVAPRNSEVFVSNVDGSDEINVSQSAAYDGWPMWSPDGNAILFSSNRSGPANIGQLYVVNPDGTNLRRLTDGPGSFVQASWSRDGKHIYAFQHWEDEQFGGLVVFQYSQ